MSRLLSQSLEIENGEREAMVRCRGCRHRLCVAREAWKAHAALQERPLKQIAAIYTTAQQLMLREFCCPSCGALLDTEIALPDDPFLEDMIDL